MAWWRQSLALTTLMAETQTVVALRLMGLAGVWPVPRNETRRMIREKPPAFTESLVAANRALWLGLGPEAVLTAWTRPLTRKARANRKRLSRGSSPGPRAAQHRE